MLHGVFDAISEKQVFTAFDLDFYDDQIRALRFGADWSHAFSAATLVSAGLTVSQGLDALGARGTSDLSASSTGISTLGADADFTKLEGQLRFSQALPASFSTEWIARGQYSFDKPLYKSEQFSLGGPHLLSAYDAGDISGDSGWLVRGELRYDHLAQTAWATALMQPYLFASHGAVSLAEPTVLQRSTVVASALGAGARLTAAPNLAYLREVELGLEGARQFSDELGENGWRFNLYLAARY
jgi:hemolysin activation/secretion protein